MLEDPSQPKITISLRWWLELALYKCNRDYTVIELDLANQITTADPTGQICYVENRADTLDYSGNALPQLYAHLVRCWDAKLYRESFDHRVKLREESARVMAEMDARRKQLDDYRRDLTESFKSKGVPESVSITLVTGMTPEVLEIAWKQLQMNKP